MIEKINAHVQGKLGNDNIDDIKFYIADIIETRFPKVFDVACNPKGAADASRFAEYLMFGQEHYIYVNSKNIEFQDGFHYSGLRPQSDYMAKLIQKSSVKDFLVRFWVYRLGQYSYFAAEVTPLIEDQSLIQMSDDCDISKE